MGSDTYVNNGYIINIDDDSDYDDYSNPDPTSYYRNISLRYFAAEPQEMLTEHTKLKELCLENGNPEAHYIEGILQYLVKEDKRAGLRHLRLSSIRKNSNGEIRICNAFDSSLVLINPHIKEAQALNQMFYGEEDKVNKNHVPKVTTREKRKKWGQTPFKTIQDMKRTDKGEICRVICVVYAVDTSTGWYYCACVVCNNKVSKSTISFDEIYVPKWWCESCQLSFTKVIPRYKLDLLVQDQTGESRFTLEDSVSTTMVKSTASRVVNIDADEIEAQEMLPPEIVAIVGKNYGFGVSVDEINKASGVEIINAIKDGKHPIPIGVDYRKCSKTQHKQKPVAAKTLDVPLSIVFPRLLNDLTNRNFASRFQSQITASNPTSKRAIKSRATQSLSSQITFVNQQTQNPKFSESTTRVTKINSGTAKHVVTDQELANDDQDNEDLQANIDEFSELESECSSQQSLDTDTSDDEQPSIDLEQGKDNQADRVKFLAELFRKHFSAPKPKLKPLSRKEDGLVLSDSEKKLYALIEIEKLMKKSGSSLSLYESMPKIPENHKPMENVLILDELSYDLEAMQATHDRDILLMTDEQRKIYDEIVSAVVGRRGGMFFVDGFGGTGKTFIGKLLSAAIRCRGDIVLNTASSGIASLLLQGGRTAHSRFAIPINPDEFSTCILPQGSDKANLVKEASLIIWDEAPMMSKHCFESLDRTLNDLMGTHDQLPFGGKVIVFGGDFRQVLPVITGAGRPEIVGAAMNSSYLWNIARF
ncbi:hypothetical protein Bca4012_026239 [Brassica carinata]